MSKLRKIMIIDDSKVSRMMISSIIKSSHKDIELLEASDGKEAIELSTKNDIDFFSVDLNMPGIDGLELISILKKHFPESKFALLTANIQETVKENARNIGTKCFNKPISEDNINNMMAYFYG